MKNVSSYTGKVISYSMTGAGTNSSELVCNIESRPGAESWPFSVGFKETEPEAFISFVTMITGAYYQGTPVEVAWQKRSTGSLFLTAVFVPPVLARKHRLEAKKSKG